MPNVMASLPNMGGALCESSVIPFLVAYHAVKFGWRSLLACRAVTLPIYENTRLGRKVNFAPGRIMSKGKNPRKCICRVPAQETAKYLAKFGWPPVSDVAAVTNLRRETRWNSLGCPKQPNRSQPLLWGHVEEILLFNKFFSDWG